MNGRPQRASRVEWMWMSSMVAASLLCFGTGPRSAHAQEGEQEAKRDGALDADQDARYREAIDAAVAEFGRSQWQEAIVLFREAHRLRPSAKTHRGLGQALFEARDYVGAIPHLEAALSAPRNTFAAAQREVLERALAQARSFVARLQLVVQPEDASLTIDSRPVTKRESLLLNPGEHTIVARAAEHQPFQQRLTLEGGQQQTLRIRLVPVAPPSAAIARSDEGGTTPVIMDEAESAPTSDGAVSLATLGFVSAGLAVAGLGTALVLWRVHEDGPVETWKANECETIRTLTTTCKDADEQASNLKTASVIAAIAGGVFAATAITLLALPDAEQPQASASLSCGVGAGALFCHGSF